MKIPRRNSLTLDGYNYPCQINTLSHEGVHIKAIT